jgi:alpha-L-glutamate ligase-like protein
MLGAVYRRRGILGMNSRNIDYIFRYNPRKKYPFADDKMRFKAVAQEAGLSVPQLYGAIYSVGETEKLYRLLRKNSRCVIKPAHGSGGEGVLVLDKSDSDGVFVRANGNTMTFTEIRHHIAKTIHGMYSLGGQSDVAMIEYRVQVDPVFENVSYRGVPDIRIIVFRGVPIMAMIRLPTKASNGRANLHQGAVAAGIVLATGITRNGVQGSSRLTRHPDTGESIEGIQIPHWDTLLENASRCYDFTGLGYLGVDIVLDETYGPMILEINARPGLAVQIANQTGLKNRLRHVEKEGKLLGSTAARIAFGKAAARYVPE